MLIARLQEGQNLCVFVFVFSGMAVGGASVNVANDGYFFDFFLLIGTSRGEWPRPFCSRLEFPGKPVPKQVHYAHARTYTRKMRTHKLAYILRHTYLGTNTYTDNFFICIFFLNIFRWKFNEKCFKFIIYFKEFIPEKEYEEKHDRKEGRNNNNNKNK